VEREERDADGSAIAVTVPRSAPNALAASAAWFSPKLPYFQTTSTPRSNTIAATSTSFLRRSSLAAAPISRPAAKFTTTQPRSTNTNSPAPHA
jgi:hypothetical protein